MRTVCIVSCAAKKRDGSHAAKDLYVSDLFSKSARYAEENSDEYRHGDRDSEGVGQSEEEDLSHIRQCRAVADHHLQDVRQIPHEQDESEERAPNQSV